MATTRKARAAKAKPTQEPKGAQTDKGPPRQLAGIQFATEPGSDDPNDGAVALPPPPSQPKDPRMADALPEQPAGRTKESDQRNQEAAKAAIERMKTQPRRRPIVAERPRAPSPDDPHQPVAPKLYRVLQEAQVARGASHYRLPAGKIIADREYDIVGLRRRGVRLLPVNPDGTERREEPEQAAAS